MDFVCYYFASLRTNGSHIIWSYGFLVVLTGLWDSFKCLLMFAMQEVCCSNLLSVVFYSKDHWELNITWKR